MKVSAVGLGRTNGLDAARLRCHKIVLPSIAASKQIPEQTTSALRLRHRDVWILKKRCSANLTLDNQRHPHKLACKSPHRFQMPSFSQGPGQLLRVPTSCRWSKDSIEDLRVATLHPTHRNPGSTSASISSCIETPPLSVIRSRNSKTENRMSHHHDCPAHCERRAVIRQSRDLESVTPAHQC
eukprot:3933083-Rhodomonas_salina.1